MRHLRLGWELRRWRAAGRRAELWWRDDDATEASPALDRLLAISAEARTPVTLAVIPAGDMAGLARRLEAAPLVSVVQHGVDHVNRRAGRAAGEFPHDWPERHVTLALQRGWRLMQDLPRALPVFVPPWNDVHPQLATALASGGYRGWSAHGALVGRHEPQRYDAHLDLLRWRGGARFRGRGRFLGALTVELRRRRLVGRWDAPIGVLTHHKVHDAQAWAFLEDFLAWSAREPALGWASLDALLAPHPVSALIAHRSA